MRAASANFFGIKFHVLCIYYQLSFFTVNTNNIILSSEHPRHCRLLQYGLRTMDLGDSVPTVKVRRRLFVST